MIRYSTKTDLCRCYTVNVLRYLSGVEPKVVSAKARLMRPQVDECMEAKFHLDEAGTSTGSLLATFRAAVLPSINLQVKGDKGELYCFNWLLPHPYHYLTVTPAGGAKRTEKVYSGHSSYYHQLQAFVAAVKNNKEIPTNGKDGVKNMALVDAIYAAAGLQKRGIPLNE